MKLYKCAWPNGDVSVVLARDKLDALVRLDEWGDAAMNMVTEIRVFMADFVLANGPALLALRARLGALPEEQYEAARELADETDVAAPEICVQFCERTEDETMRSLSSFVHACEVAALQLAQQAELDAVPGDA
jgi:hypothetical protein